MPVEITLIGFGDDRPAAFAAGNRLLLDIATPTTPRAVIAAAGITEPDGLILMNTVQVIPARQWGEALIQDRDRLTLLSAFEGG